MIKKLNTTVFVALVCLFTSSLALADKSSDLRSLKAAHQSFSMLTTDLDDDEYGKIFGDTVLFHSKNTVVPIFLPTREAAVDFFTTVIFPRKTKGLFSFNSRMADFNVTGNTGIVHGIRQVRDDPRVGFMRFMEVWAKDEEEWVLTAYNEISMWGPEGKVEMVRGMPNPKRSGKAKVK